MTSSVPGTQIREWKRDSFSISTSPTRLQPKAINAAFDSDFLYWTKPLLEDEMATMLSHSLCFGLYHESESPPLNPQADTPSNAVQIGLARLITDRVTFAYMTDVYVLPEHQGKGLGKWLVGCVRETLDAWPALRGTLLYASEGREAPFYRALMGVEAWVQGEDGMLIMTRRYAGSGMYHG